MLKGALIMQYPMFHKTDKPLFSYIVLGNGHDYYLFDNFDEAFSKAKSLSAKAAAFIYEITQNADDEYVTVLSFTFYSGKSHYNLEHPGLHVYFYMNAGEWLNPNQEWLEKLSA